MLFRMLYDDRLAQAAYLIGCQRTGEAVIIDPQRDVDRYFTAARKEGLRIVAATETHIHADFLSGSRELCDRHGVTAYLSDEGGPDWSYRWSASGSGKVVKLMDRSTFRVGNIEFTAVHTPGHTPEHLVFLVADRGGIEAPGGDGVVEPMGVASGDFVFVGDVGRPDLLETAAGVSGAKEPSARALFRSIKALESLPDYLQVWPGHGAGSACGKALGAVPQSTLGYERRHNAAIRAATREDAFVEFILSGQPEPPMYFARMKRDNRDGPRILGGVPTPRSFGTKDLATIDARRTAIIDTRPWSAYLQGHVRGSIWAPLDTMFPMVTGTYVSPDEDIVVIAEPSSLDEAVRCLVRIGLDRVVGWMAPGELEGVPLTPAREVDVAEARRLIESGRVFRLDVRREGEFAEAHIDGAMLAPYTRLPEHLSKIPRDRPILVNCRSGQRSGRACSYLERLGLDAINLKGGFLAWQGDSSKAACAVKA